MNTNEQQDRRKSDRRISPAIGEYAIQENARLRAENAELVEALHSMLNLEQAAFYGAYRIHEERPTHELLEVTYHCDKARAAIARAEKGE